MKKRNFLQGMKVKSGFLRPSGSTTGSEALASVVADLSALVEPTPDQKGTSGDQPAPQKIPEESNGPSTA